MSLTGWTVALAAVGMAGFFGRKRWLKKSHQAKLDVAKRKKQADQAELDRIACRELGQSLMSSAPGGGRKESAGASGAGGGGSSG